MTTNSRIVTTFFLVGFLLFVFSACSDDDNADPCEGTDLAVAFTSSGLTITAEATGGTAPYEFSVDGTNFQTSADFDLSGGNAVTLTVRDANNCEATINIPSCEASDLAVTFTSSGSTVTAEATGGTSPYEFSIDGTNFQASADFDLSDGSAVTLTVKDANGCEATVEVPACEASDLAVTFIPTGFSITAEATGGTAPYEFSVDGTNFQTSADFDLPEGNAVTLMVRDANACEATVDVSAAEVQSVLDTRDDRVYSVFKSGDQLWLGENLRYRPDDLEGIFCFDDVEANCEEDGVIYNFAGAENACPAGWGLATRAQWQTLVDAFGGNTTAGAALREGGSSGFDAELAGFGNASTFFERSVSVRYWINASNRIMVRSDRDAVSFNVTESDLRHCVRCIKN